MNYWKCFHIKNLIQFLAGLSVNETVLIPFFCTSSIIKTVPC